MGEGLGFPPVATLLLAAFIFAIISDLLVEVFSVRISLCSGRLQAWMFDHMGQSRIFDFLIAMGFQFLSFRKKAFFVQLCSFINVGSFSRQQTFLILLGSFFGIGASVLLLSGVGIHFGLLLILFAAGFSLLPREQHKDLGMGFLSLGLFLISFYWMDLYFSSSGIHIQKLQIPDLAIVLGIGFVTLIFRGSVAFLIFLSIILMYLAPSPFSVFLLLGLHSFLALWKFYSQALSHNKRLSFSIRVAFFIQLVQFLTAFFLVEFFGESWSLWVGSELLFSQAFQCSLILYFIYNSVTLLVLFPVLFFMDWIPTFQKQGDNKQSSQKILIIEGRGHTFSIHQALFLLRQEFKKFTTSVHTFFKMSREARYDNEDINRRFVRYHGILQRVGDELKELCFSIGRQRSYRWQVEEIMSYYRYVNQLELLIDDLSYVASMLRQKGLNEEWEKDCRYWLGLQLKVFESFLEFSIGVGQEDEDKLQAHIDKSYDLLDRFFVDSPQAPGRKNSSQTFYRITESLANLTRGEAL